MSFVLLLLFPEAVSHTVFREVLSVPDSSAPAVRGSSNHLAAGSMILFMKDLQRAVASILQRRSNEKRRGDAAAAADACSSSVAVDAQYLQSIEKRVRDMEVPRLDMHAA